MYSRNTTHQYNVITDTLRVSLFLIIIDLSVEISDNPTKRLIYFCFCSNLLQRFELREARIEKRENLRFSRSRLDYKLSENKQGHNMIYLISHRSTSNIALQTIIWFLSFSLKTHNFLQIDAESRSLWTLLGNKKNSTYSLVTMFINFYVK